MLLKFCILACVFIHQILTVLWFIGISLLFPTHHTLFSSTYIVLKNILCVYYLIAVPYSACFFMEVHFGVFKCLVFTSFYGLKCVCSFRSSMLISSFTLRT
jgi:hypothetical protein